MYADNMMWIALTIFIEKHGLKQAQACHAAIYRNLVRCLWKSKKDTKCQARESIFLLSTNHMLVIFAMLQSSKMCSFPNS